MALLMKLKPTLYPRVCSSVLSYIKRLEGRKELVLRPFCFMFDFFDIEGRKFLVSQENLAVDQDSIDVEAVSCIGQEGHLVVSGIPVQARAVDKGNIGFIARSIS